MRLSFSHATFRRNLLLNLLMMAVILLVIHLMFSSMNAFYYEQELTLIRDKLETEKLQMEYQFDNWSMLLNQNVYSDEISRMLVVNSPLKTWDYITVLNAQKYLASLIAANDYVADVILCFFDSEVFLTNKRSYLSVQEFLKLYEIQNLPLESITMRPERAEYTILPGAIADSEAAFIYQIPITMEQVVYPDNCAFILIARDKLLEGLLTPALRDWGSIEILNRNGETVFVYGPAVSQKESAALVETTAAHGQLTIRAILPDAYFDNVLSEVRNFRNASTLVLTGLGILSAFCAAWLETAPMRKLLRNLAAEGVGLPDQQDEYAWLQGSISRMYSDHQEVFVRLNQQHLLMQMSILEQLLSGISLTNAQRERTEAVFTELPRPFVVGYAQIFFSSASESEQTEEMRSLVIRQQLESIMPKGTIIFVYDGNTIALLIPCMDMDMHELAAELNKRLLQLDALLPEHRIHMVLSQPLTELDDIPNAFDLARTGYDSSRADEPIVISGERVNDLPAYSMRGLTLLYEYVIAGEQNAAQQELRRVVESPYQRGGSIRQRFYVLRAILLLCTADASLDSDCITSLHYSSTMNAQSLLDIYTEAITQLTSRINLEKARREDAQSHEIIEYILAHYTDNDCCPASISSALQVSEKQLSAILREQMNVTPAAYLQQLRLRHAAKLLSSTELTTQQIGECCGFANFNTFYKAFKRDYGVSPTQYRKDTYGAEGDM